MRTPVKNYLAAVAILWATGAGCDDARTDQQTTTGEHAIVYDVYGTGGPTLVLVHGGASDVTAWAPIIERQRERRRVIAIDLLGHGRSDKPILDGDPRPVFADSVAQVLRAEDVDDAILVGHSFGVSVSRDVAIAEPGRVRGLVMLDGFLAPIVPLDQRDGFLAAFMAPTWEQTVADFIEDNMFASDTPEPVKRSVRAMMQSAPQHVWLDVLSVATDPGVLQTTPIDLPALGVFTRSPYVAQEYLDFLPAIFPDLEIERTEAGTGHFVMLETPDEFDAAIETIVRRAVLD